MIMATALQFPTQAQSLTKAADAMLKASKAKLDWKTVDVDTLPHDLRSLYDTYKAAQAIAAEHRQAFEDAICGPLAKMLNAKAGQDVVFTYRFGLGVALADQRQPRANALRF
jgi:hypothetical protein